MTSPSGNIKALFTGERMRTASFVVMAIMTVTGFLGSIGALKGVTNGFVDGSQLSELRGDVSRLNQRVDGIDSGLSSLKRDINEGFSSLHREITAMRFDAGETGKRIAVQEAKLQMWVTLDRYEGRTDAKSVAYEQSPTGQKKPPRANVAASWVTTVQNTKN